MIHTEITTEPIESVPGDNHHKNEGAELIFHGRVRDTEAGDLISALDYEHYPEMAENELEALAHRTAKKFSVSDIICIHRVGEIPVGHISMQVIIWSKHRDEGLKAMTWFISQLKRDVPIWKFAVLPDGRRIPSICDHPHESEL